MIALAICASCDSARVTVSLFDDPSLSVVTVTEEPRVCIGGEDDRDGFQIGQLVSVILFRDHLVLADASYPEVRTYDLSGSLVSRYGKRGRGPGAFLSITALSRFGDTATAIWDRRLRRLTIVNQLSGVERSVQPDLTGTRQLVPAFVGAMADGTVVFRDARDDSSLRNSPPGPQRDSVAFLFVSTGDTPRVARRTLPGDERFLMRKGTAWGTKPIIFGGSLHQAVAAGRLVAARTDDSTIRVYDGTGNRVHTKVVAWSPWTVSDADIERERRRLLEEEAAARSKRPQAFLNGIPIGEVLGPFEEGLIEALPARHVAPAFSRMLVDAEGRAWFEEFDLSRSARNWVVLDTLLEPRARVVIPSGLILHDAGYGVVVGERMFALGREAVCIYDMVPPSRPPHER